MLRILSDKGMEAMFFLQLDDDDQATAKERFRMEEERESEINLHVLRLQRITTSFLGLRSRTQSEEGHAGPTRLWRQLKQGVWI